MGWGQQRESVDWVDVGFAGDDVDDATLEWFGRWAWYCSPVADAGRASRVASAPELVGE